MKKFLLLLLFLPFVFAVVPPDDVCFELYYDTFCIVPDPTSGQTAMYSDNGNEVVISGDLRVKGDIITDIEATQGLTIGDATAESISFDGEDLLVKDDAEFLSDMFVKNDLTVKSTLNTSNLDVENNVNVSLGNVSAQYFHGNGTFLSDIETCGVDMSCEAVTYDSELENDTIVRGYNTSWILNNQAYWNGTDSNFLNLSAQTFYSPSYLSDSMQFNFYDDGSELFLNASGVSDAFSVETENSKLVLYNEPSDANENKVFQVYSKQASFETEFIVHKAGPNNAAWFARSLRIGGPAGSGCANITDEVHCNTSIDGADLVVQNSIWLNNTVIAKNNLNASHNISVGHCSIIGNWSMCWNSSNNRMVISSGRFE